MADAGAGGDDAGAVYGDDGGGGYSSGSVARRSVGDDDAAGVADIERQHSSCVPFQMQPLSADGDYPLLQLLILHSQQPHILHKLPGVGDVDDGDDVGGNKSRT